MPTKSEVSFQKMISLAEIHREANRPLIKIKDFDGKQNFVNVVLYHRGMIFIYVHVASVKIPINSHNMVVVQVYIFLFLDFQY